MMEDTGEDVLRQKPSFVSTLFKRIGQVRFSHMSNEFLLTLRLNKTKNARNTSNYRYCIFLFADLRNLVRQVDASRDFSMGFHSCLDYSVPCSNCPETGTNFT